MKNLINLLLCCFLINSCNGQKKQGNSAVSNYKIPKDSYVIDSIILNIENKTIKILALEKNNNRNIEISQHNSLPVIILEKNGNSFIKIGENKKVFFAYNDNCPADGFQGLVGKDNYFTIEQTYCLDFKFVYSYTTFKIDSKSGDILLHKFSETYTSRNNQNEKIPNRIWTKKDFGTVIFTNVAEDFLKGLRKNKHTQ
ncbi:hypothetical protein AB9T88_02310 [Flavobacterium sp. LBUM151]